MAIYFLNNRFHELFSVWLSNFLRKVHDIPTHLCQESNWMTHSVLDRQMFSMLLISNCFSQVPIFCCLICNALLMLKPPLSLTGYGLIIPCVVLDGMGRSLIMLVLLKVVAG